MARYVARRLLLSVPLLLGVAVIIFFLTRVVPGDPARVIAGPLAPPEEVERLRVEYGLDRPLLVQFVAYMSDLMRGNLGTSLRTRGPVVDEILARLPNTVRLILVSLAAASLVGIPVGILSAVRRESAASYLATSVSLFGVSMPVFWSGLLLIFFFAVTLQWLPSGGYGTARHYVLPSLTLAFFNLASIVRVTRSSALEVLGHDYVRTARAKGLAEGAVVFKHVLKNAAIPIVTTVGVQFGSLLGGTVLTETVFAWPGIGRLMVDSIFARDYTVLQGTVLIFAAIIVGVNLLTDLSYAALDPRVRFN